MSAPPAPRRTGLDGGCYVLGPDDLAWTGGDAWREAPLVDRAGGAAALSQYRVRVAAGRSPCRSYPGSDAALFVLRGAGSLGIGGRAFEIGPDTGAFVKAGEAFEIAVAGAGPLELLVGVCPECPAPRRHDAMPDRFDAAHPQRTVRAAERARHAMGDRFYQVLVGDEIGSMQVTQFIGFIPQSRAPEHYHHYEEAITVLSGTGRLWTGARSAPVGPGSAIFLPRRQPHALECTDPAGLRLVGLFYPAGSPAANYPA